MGRQGFPLYPLNIEHQNIQFSGSGDLGVQLPQRAGGGVAGIGKQRLSPALTLLIQHMKHLFGHKHLSPYNEPGRRIRYF